MSRRSVNAQNIANHIEQTYVCSDINSRTNVVPKLEKNNVNITEQDCNDFVHDNRFAVLCVDSSEDEGDSLEFDTVNNPDTFCTVKGCQGGESVGNDTYLGKIPSSFTGNSAPNVSECPNVVETCPTKIYNIGRQFNRTNRIPTTASSETLSIDKGTVTGVGGYNGDSVIDKYCLEIQSTVKCEKIRIAKTNHANAKCIRQNTPLFGFIPIYGLKSRICDRKENDICQNIMDLHTRLRKDGRHNYVGLQVPVKSKLNAEKWASYLAEYWDWQLPLLVKYGFPLDFERNTTVCHSKINHNSAIQYPDHVVHYLKEEVEHGAIVGPFIDPPIKNLHVSPFMTRDKSSSDHRRVIIDLSWPIGQSVNSGVDSDKYLDTEFVLTYPSIDNITDEVLKLGKGCKIFKVDISRAFRHVPIDPGDLDLLGLYWEGYFLDQFLPFGFKHGSSIFQRLSDGIRYIMNLEGHQVWNYIDDFLCVSLPSKITKTYDRLQVLLQELGLTVSSKKLVPPATQVTCLGIVVNTEDFSLSIPAEKLSQIKQLCKKWANKMVCTKRELQSLLGSLLYVAKCIQYARFFLNRMLTLLRENFDKKSITVTADFKKDLNWFNTFLSVYNGVSFFQHVTGKVVHLDACPQGLGAIFDNQVYALPLPFTYHQLNIAYLEMLNILVALKVWHREWAGARIQVKCDNQAVVSVLNSGRSRDSVMAEYARNIFMWVSTFNIDIKVVHVPGKLNEVADLLSRWFITKNNVEKLHHLVHPVIWIPVSNALLYTDKTI